MSLPPSYLVARLVCIAADGLCDDAGAGLLVLLYGVTPGLLLPGLSETYRYSTINRLLNQSFISYFQRCGAEPFLIGSNSRFTISRSRIRMQHNQILILPDILKDAEFRVYDTSRLYQLWRVFVHRVNQIFTSDARIRKDAKTFAYAQLY